MRALVTRPLVDAWPLAEALSARGFAVWIEPMLEIESVRDPRLSFEEVQGVLVTSLNGVRALAINTDRRDLPVWAVGEVTANEALRSGFRWVDAAEGNVETLAARVTAHADPGKGPLLHVTGSHVAGDLARWLHIKGFEVRRAVLYEARTPRSLSPDLRDLLAARRIDVAFFFSPRTAKTFVTLVQAARLDEGCAATTAFALSTAVAAALGPLAWREVRVAVHRSQKSLLAALDADRAASPAKE